MSKQISQPLSVYGDNPNQAIAQVVLNGYNIQGTGPLGTQRGVIRSFRITTGSLAEHWNSHTPLMLRNEQGNLTPVRIAAFPVDENAFGLLEFL